MYYCGQINESWEAYSRSYKLNLVETYVEFLVQQVIKSVQGHSVDEP